MNKVLTIENKNLADFEFKILASLSEFYGYKEQWNAINGQLLQKNPLMSYEWIASFLEGVESDQSPFCVLLCSINGQLIAGLPLVLKRVKRFGIYINQLELPFDNQTMSVDILVIPGYEAYVIEPLLDRAFKAFKNVDQIVFRRIDGVNSSLSQLKSLKSSVSEYCEDGASLTIPTNFSDYRNQLGKNFKSNLNKSNNKAKRLGKIEFSVHELNGLSNLKKLDIVCKLEDSGWKGRDGTSILKNIEDYDFYKRLISKLDKTYNLFFHFLMIEGEVVAANLGIRQGDKVLLWKLAYDEAFKKISPGGLLLEKLISHLSETKEIKIIDLMTNENWYNNWNMSWRPFHNVFIFKASMKGHYLKSIFILKKLLKSVFNSVN